MNWIKASRIGVLIVTTLVPFKCFATDGWPRQLQSAASKVLLYEPQPESLKGNLLAARCALSIQEKNQVAPDWGTVWMDAEMQIDRDTRTMKPTSVTVMKVSFPNASPDRLEKIRAFVEDRVSKFDEEISMDGVLAQLAAQNKESEVQPSPDPDKNAVAQPTPNKYSTDPPVVKFVDHPAVLMTYDGDPQMRPIPGSAMTQAVNTPFFVAFDPTSKTYYLKGGSIWYTAPDALGPWKVLAGANPPAEILNAAKGEFDDGSTDVAATDTSSQEPALDIIVATKPTELIQTDGEPVYKQIGNTDLLFVSNTESDVFMESNTKKIYVLLSGRWFTADTFDGPWTYVPSDKLPEDFANIPEDSEKGNVLSSITGTVQANEAVMDSNIPQTTYVKTTDPGVAVQYDGDPQFQNIEGTNLQYAVNTPYSVVRSGSGYYCCDQGIWYQCPNAVGDYAIATSIPDEIYSIPSSCPIYNVCSCHIYGTWPGGVCVGYTPGYLGCYAWNGCVIYGTGFPYRCWVGNYCFARPCTWGFNARYNPWRGSWGYAWGVQTHSGFRGIGIGNRPNGWLGVASGLTGGWFGPSGYHFHRPDYITSYARNKERQLAGTPLPNFNRPSNIYRDRTPKALDYRHDQRLNTQLREHIREVRVVASNTPGRLGGSRVSPRGQPAISRDNSGNTIFSDKNGNIFRRDNNSWVLNGNKGWIRPGQTPVPSSVNARQPETSTHERPRIEPRETQRSELNRPIIQPAHPALSSPVQRPVMTPAPRIQQPIISQPRLNTPQRTPQPSFQPRQPISESPTRELDSEFQARQRGALRITNFQQSIQPQIQPRPQIQSRPMIQPQPAIQSHPAIQSRPSSPAPAPQSRPSSGGGQPAGRGGANYR